MEIPHNAITVVTGVSGSGKSSLAFDTMYAEGQRRYIESLSAYARQFLERIEKPEVDEITGIAPAIAIRQKNTTRNPRSTVATATEIYDYLRLLYARAGRTFCARCGNEVRRDTMDEIADRVLALPDRAGVSMSFSNCVWRQDSAAREKRAMRANLPRPSRKSCSKRSPNCRNAASIASIRTAGCTNSLPRKICWNWISRNRCTYWWTVSLCRRISVRA